MAFLRRVLYLQATVFFVSGLGLAIVPRLLLVNLFSQLPLPDYAWIQVVGVQAIVLAMFMVLVAQRSEQVWWWSWAFVVVSAAVTIIAVVNAVGRRGPRPPSIAMLTPGPHESSSVLWWLLAAVNAAFTVALLWGLGRTGQERPLPQID